MVNNDSINHDHDDMSTSTFSSTFSTTVKFSGLFGNNSMSRVSYLLAGIEGSNNNSNCINLSNTSDSEINHDGNDNQSHSVFFISSSISSSSSVCIIDRPLSISIFLVSFKTPVFDHKEEEEKKSFYISKYPSTVAKNNKKTSKQLILDIIASSKYKSLV